MSIIPASWPRYVAETSDPEESTSTTHPGRAKKIFVSAALMAGLSFSAAPGVSADVRNVGGGIWSYGVARLAPNTNWSDYYHASKSHGSSVTGDRGLVRSACMSKGRWSRASAWDSNPFRIDQAFWRYC